MNWLEFVSKIIDSMVWPSVLVIVISIFKEPLSGILNKVGSLLSFKYKDVVQVEFKEDLINLELATKEIETRQNDEEHQFNMNEHVNSEAKTNEHEIKNQRFYENLAKKSPEQAVYSAWLELEKELRYSLVRLNKETMEDIPQIVKDLLFNDYISAPMANSILGTWHLRNDLVKNPNAVSLDTEEAIRYLTIVFKLIKALKEITGDYYMSGEKLSD
ncbi:hypothetical protein [Bacillus altitudinis]|uniref:hypothetical protein n=1 Tax=Bacillus altitudinis TaxID=293387 RepID=UPI001B83B6A3|nr:hypothetical protein [Bacillus altitudinis]MBR0581301.1 hypothetical protein [Bacillus altitudinis A23-8]